MTSEVSSPDHDPTMTMKASAALDAAAPFFAPMARRWDAAADRRKTLRTPENLRKLLEAQRANTSARSVASLAKSQRKAARSASHNPLSAARRAAKTADRAASIQAKAARTKLRSARRDYPSTLMSVAVRAHVGHVLPAGFASYALSSPTDWAMWPVSTSIAFIAANFAVLALGRRAPSLAESAEGMTAAERRLAERLDPSYWVQHADARGLSGTVPTPAKLTEAGLVSHVRLDAKWTPKAFSAKADEIRALIGARTDLRMEIKAGSHGDRATITLRTRSAADGIDMKGWKPGDAWAVDTVTGETVPVPLGKRILIAGTSGSGKSTSARPLLAEASEPEDHRLVVIDRKYIEGRTWEHRARVASELEDIREVVDELIAEGEERLKSLPRGEDTVVISASRPRITVFVDEMAELLSDCAEKFKDEDGKSADYLDVISGLRTIARKYRAAEIILVPATQKPTLSGDGHGLDSQIAGQLTVRLALAVATSTETQSVFGPDAIEKGWRAHDLPMPWVALMRDQEKGPKQRTSPIQMRWMTAQQVIELPDRPIWSREKAFAGSESRTALRLVKGEAAGVEVPAAKDAPIPTAIPSPSPSPSPAGPATNRVRVVIAVRDGARTVRDVADRTGLNKGTVSKLVKALVESGDLVKNADAGLILGGAKEVSA